LDDCVASLHASNNLQIKFNCLKWNMTGVRPSGDVKSCGAPLKAMSLDKAIYALKPGDVDVEAALREFYMLQHARRRHLVRAGSV